MVTYDPTTLPAPLPKRYEEFTGILPAEIFTSETVPKETIIERIISGSASFIHFLEHGGSGGRAHLTTTSLRQVMATSCFFHLTHVLLSLCLISSNRQIEKGTGQCSA